MGTDMYARRTRLPALGFTITELMITVCVVAILAGWGVPNLLQYTRQIRQTSAVNNFIGVLTQARSEAITRNETILVCPVVNQSTTCEAANTSDWGSGALIRTDSGGEIIRVFDNLAGGGDLSLSSNAQGGFAKPGRVYFAANGSARRSLSRGDTRIFFLICASTLKKRWVTLDRGGSIKAQKVAPDGSEADVGCS